MSNRAPVYASHLLLFVAVAVAIVCIVSVTTIIFVVRHYDTIEMLNLSHSNKLLNVMDMDAVYSLGSSVSRDHLCSIRKEWTYEWYHHSNKFQNRLQTLFANYRIVCKLPTKGEISQPQHFDARIVSLVSLVHDLNQLCFPCCNDWSEVGQRKLLLFVACSATQGIGTRGVNAPPVAEPHFHDRQLTGCPHEHPRSGACCDTMNARFSITSRTGCLSPATSRQEN
jgi:hypothetical protein